MSLKSKAKARAYRAGYRDGLDWDLEAFESVKAVRLDREGWDEATFQAIGERQFFVSMGLGRSLNSRGDLVDRSAFRAALRSYNKGAHRGACAPQETRTGLPAGESS